MPRASWVDPAFYDVAERLRDDCLIVDGSLFSRGAAVWTREAAQEWDESISVYDSSDRSFGDKLRDQLSGLSPAAVQFAAESLYVALLAEADTGSAKKLEHVTNALSVLDSPPRLDEELLAAMRNGIATYGQGGRNRRDAHLRYLASFVSELKLKDLAERRLLLSDPRAFRSFAFAVPERSGQMQREALLHLLFPDEFESTVSGTVKRKIAEAFSVYVDDPQVDVDTQIASIREGLTSEYPDGFSFWDDEVRSIWDRGSSSSEGLGGWIVRGERAYGTNLVPRWLAEGFVSMGATPEGEVKAGMTTREIMDLVASSYPDASRQKLIGGANAGRQFASEIRVGDWVMTRDGSNVYAGRITSEQTWHPDSEDGTARRRTVDWVNPDQPLAWAELPESLRKRATNPNTVWNLKDQSEVLASLFEEPGGTAWSEYLSWAEKIYAVPSFDLEERDYKLEVAAKMSEARRLCEAGDESWLPALRRAFGPPNNMTAWRANDDLLSWCSANPEQARVLLVRLWSSPDDIGPTFVDWPVETSAGNKVALVSLLLLAADPARFPVFRATVLRRTFELLDLESRVRVTNRESAGAELAEWYGDFVDILSEIVQKLAERGTDLRDLMDAQSIAWWLAAADPPEEWSEEEQMAFREWRGDTVADPRPSGGIDVPDVTEDVADSLHVPRQWLQEIVDLLNERRQIVFYGPPGTGKTLIAQRLGELGAAAGGSFELIQFHPAYSYEDFFEGFRPQAAKTGTGVSYALRHGPLRRAVTRAIADPTKPHILVIDELNRGNVAKIFGELFFLLEYRDRAIPLQYSPEERFALPKNLFFIGTMNTADRSIALVDSALRRRFYFVPFLPTEPPLVHVLEKWLAAEELDPQPALILKRLNEAIGAQEFSIGPSYFMAARGPAGIDLDRVWRFAIKPLLEEHYYGTGRSVDEFSFASLLRQYDAVDQLAEDEDPAEA